MLSFTLNRRRKAILVGLALQNLVDVEEAARYRHVYFWRALAQEPAVAARLKDLKAEAKKGGEEIWAYIVEQQLQL